VSVPYGTARPHARRYSSSIGDQFSKGDPSNCLHEFLSRPEMPPRPPSPRTRSETCPPASRLGGIFVLAAAMISRNFKKNRSGSLFFYALLPPEQSRWRKPGIVLTCRARRVTLPDALPGIRVSSPRFLLSLGPRAKRGALFFAGTSARARARPASRASAARASRARSDRGRQPRASRTAPCRRSPRSRAASPTNRRPPAWR
jgi:hypothetical protein